MKIIKQLFCDHDWDATDTSGHCMVCVKCELEWSIYESWGEKYYLGIKRPDMLFSLEERVSGFFRHKFLARTQHISWNRLELI
jgi:hypothetical protein